MTHNTPLQEGLIELMKTRGPLIYSLHSTSAIAPCASALTRWAPLSSNGRLGLIASWSAEAGIAVKIAPMLLACSKTATAICTCTYCTAFQRVLDWMPMIELCL